MGRSDGFLSTGLGKGAAAVVATGCGVKTLAFRACFVTGFNGFIRLLLGFFISARYV